MPLINRADCEFEREPFLAPFGFKGSYLNEMWQTAVRLQTEGGLAAIGLGAQSVLWSDAAVFAENSESAGNAMMFLTTEFAARQTIGREWTRPLELLDEIIPATFAHAQTLTARPDLRLTFALNALVPVDNAAWLLHARTHGMTDFDAMIPPEFHPALPCRQEQLGCIPLVSYKVSEDSIRRLVEDGFFILKIKIGADPDGDGDQDKMLAWDQQRLAQIHNAVKDFTTPYTDTGHIAYYLDANGRYDHPDRLLRLLEHADRIGAMPRIVVLEEPFPEEAEFEVSAIPVRLAADESAHSDHDALRRIQMGYGAIALKPIAKTLSMSLKIARLAAERQVPCFCADLTVNPILVDWNKCVAARLNPLPGLKIGVLESNGHQNYRHWSRMQASHPAAGQPWTQITAGLFPLPPEFYTHSGGILADIPYCQGMFP